MSPTRAVRGSGLMIRSIGAWISGWKPAVSLWMVWRGRALAAGAQPVVAAAVPLPPASMPSVAGWATRLTGCWMRKTTGAGPGSRPAHPRRCGRASRCERSSRLRRTYLSVVRQHNQQSGLWRPSPVASRRCCVRQSRSRALWCRRCREHRHQLMCPWMMRVGPTTTASVWIAGSARRSRPSLNPRVRVDLRRLPRPAAGWRATPARSSRRRA